MIHVIKAGQPMVIKADDENYAVVAWDGEKFLQLSFPSVETALEWAELPLITQEKAVE